MKKLLLFLIAALVLIFPSRARAGYIVDTGSGWPQSGVSIYNRSDGDFQINAGQFTIAQATTITSMETWMYSSVPGTVDMVLYGDNGNLPDPTQEILRQGFSVATAATAPVTAWQGLTGLNLALNPGSYWISLEEPVIDDVFQVNLPSGAPNPLARYAYRADLENGENWTRYDGHQGFRVNALGGGSQVVPEPATIVLVGAGALGAFFRRRAS